NLCLAGGFALNAVTNARILDETPFSGLFVQPAATDSGIPLGCALWGYHTLLGQDRCFEMRSAALGAEYGPDEIEAALNSCEGIQADRVDSIEHKAARQIAAGKIIGWFQGRSEFGPRALGHRSILADPRSPASVERLNQGIKHREPFRPYAPMVLEQSAQLYFENARPSPFMVLVSEVRKDKHEQLPAITHIDGTARLQTVAPNEESRLFDLLTEYESLTGFPVLLNTSFNRAGEPIVETPADALNMFLDTDLDCLAIEDFWVEKIKN
ncbi:MAG: carbamoyltransferase, partial [Deltaproteobacteria bacterium]|nr:carbamoyltransferase [Deltaproteobacteria bacterium]